MRIATLATILLGVSLLTTGLLAQKQGAALGNFQAAFARDQKTYQTLEEKQRTLKALGAFDSARVTRALVEAYATLEREVTPYAEKRRKLLPRSKSSVTYPLREKLQPIRNLQDEILEALSAQRSDDSLAAMVRLLLRSRKNLPLTLQIALANRASEQGEKDLDTLPTLADKKKLPDEEMLVLLRLFARLGTRAQGSGPWILARLASRNADVRAEAILALAALRWPGSIEPLVARLPVEEGRLRDLVADTLARFTGQDLGPNEKSWRGWLQEEGVPYLRGWKELGTELPKKKRKVEGTGTYFDIPQDGTSILYVFDISLSMRNPMKRQRQAGDSASSPGKERRFDRLLRELHAALDGLTPNKQFGLLGFANRLYRFSDGQLPATPKNIAKAKAWLAGLELELQTNIYDALDLAFYSAGRGSSDRYYPLTVDTIFFLSDGAPTRPKTTTKGRARGLGQDVPDEILSAVRRWNPLRRIRIHTIGLGIRGPRANGLLRGLAEQNGGTYVRR